MCRVRIIARVTVSSIYILKLTIGISDFTEFVRNTISNVTLYCVNIIRIETPNFTVITETERVKINSRLSVIRTRRIRFTVCKLRAINMVELRKRTRKKKAACWESRRNLL